MLNIVDNMNLRKSIFDQPELETNRAGFGDGLVQAGKQNNRVVALCCDLTESIKMDGFRSNFPERFVEVGVAEQNLAGISAGLALSGKIPFMASYAAFSPGRNYDQVRVSIAYSNANVKIVGGHGGVSVGPDGATHQMLEDVAIMRVLPNMTVIVPADYNQAKQTTLALVDFQGPAYFRLAREPIPQVTTAKSPFAIGRANIYTVGRDVTIIANGPMVYHSLMAAKALAEDGITAEVIDCHTVKPLDKETILYSIRRTGAVVTAEEAQVAGGLGGAVAELLSQEYPVPMRRVGVQDRFGQSGEQGELLKLYNLTTEDIVRATKEVLVRKR